MRTSSNPAFRNLPTGRGGGYATFDQYGGAAGGAFAHPGMSAGTPYGQAPAGERPLTNDDVVIKSAIVFGVALVAGIATAAFPSAYWLALPALIVGLVLSLVIIFKQQTNRALILSYAAAEGVLLGALTGVLEHVAGGQYAGIGVQALIGTSGVFIGMLVIYKTGAVRVTPRFTKWMMGALVGVLVLVLVRLVLSLFDAGGFGTASPGPLGYLISIVIIGVAAFSLLLDFDQADRLVKAGAPAQYAWYVAFGLLVTVVWLYIEILRLLSYLRE